jgi:hypothetical protein
MGSSEMSRTVGRKSPVEMGACVRGVFCGVDSEAAGQQQDGLEELMVVKGDFWGRDSFN